MKLFATIENEAGKKASKAGNEYLDIDIYSGNRRIAALTVREGEYGVAVFNENDRDIRIADCAYNQMHNDGSYCAPCTGHVATPRGDEYSCSCNEGGKMENHVFWSLKDYRERGNPVCPHCDSDMYKI